MAVLGFPVPMGIPHVRRGKIKMSDEKICCLYRIHSQGTDLEYISLAESNQVTLGRDGCNDICLNNSVFISRQHAKLFKEDETWFIIDLHSGNGVYVNENKLVPSLATALRDRDVIELGKDPQTLRAHYAFRFYKAAYIQKCAEETDRTALQEKRVRVPSLCRVRDACSRNAPRGQIAERERLLRVEMARKELELEEKQREMTEKQQKLEAQLAEMSAALDAQRASQAELQTHMQNNITQLEEKEQQLAKEKSLNEERIQTIQQQMDSTTQRSQEEMQAQMDEKEMLLDMLQSQKEEREQIEKAENEQKQARQGLEQELGQLQELLSQKTSTQVQLAEHVEQLQRSQETLESELAQEKKRLQEKLEQELAINAQLEVHKHKVDVIEDVMEEELVCTICSELFVKAMSLSCSHSFCYLCIVEWMLLKQECPNCRAPVTSCVPCIVLDNTIDRIVLQLSDETKERRTGMVQERKDNEKDFEEKIKQKPKKLRQKLERMLNKSFTPSNPMNTAGGVNNPIVLEQLPAAVGSPLANTIRSYLVPPQNNENRPPPTQRMQQALNQPRAGAAPANQGPRNPFGARVRQQQQQQQQQQMQNQAQSRAMYGMGNAAGPRGSRPLVHQQNIQNMQYPAGSGWAYYPWSGNWQ